MSAQESFTMRRAHDAVLARDYVPAIRLYSKLLREDPKNIDILSKLGAVYVRADNDKNALKVYTALLKKKPDSFDALNNLGGIYRRLGRYDDSIEIFERARSLGANINSINYNLGHTYRLMGQYDKAAAAFLDVIDANPSDVLAYNHLAYIQDAQGDHETAQTTFARGLQIDPNHPILHYNAAASCISLKRYERAAFHYEAALRAKPGWIEAMAAYAEALEAMNRPDAAKAVLKQAVKLNASNIQAHNRLGLFYAEKGNFFKAEKSYTQALEIDKNNRAALTGLEKIYVRQKKYSDAAVIMEHLETLYPNDGEIITEHAKILIQLNQMGEAAHKLKKVRDTAPNDLEALSALAQYFIRTGETEKAHICFKRIRILNPNEAAYLLDNARQFSYMGEFLEAQKLLKDYLAKSPADAMAWADLGTNYEAAAQYREALFAWQRSLELAGGNSAIIENLAALKQYLHNDPEAMELITALIDKNSGGDLKLNDLESMIAAKENFFENIMENRKHSLAAAQKDNETTFVLEAPKIEDAFDKDDEEDGLDDLLRLDARFAGTDLPEDFDHMLLDNQADESIYAADKAEHFDLSKLIPPDEPLDFDPKTEPSAAFDNFDGKNSSHYDPIEEQEYLAIDGVNTREDFDDDEAGAQGRDIEMPAVWPQASVQSQAQNIPASGTSVPPVAESPMFPPPARPAELPPLADYPSVSPNRSQSGRQGSPYAAGEEASYVQGGRHPFAGGDQVFPDETGFSDKDPSTGLPPFSKTPLSSKDEPFFDDQDLLAEHDVPPESDELFENPPETGLEADAEVLNEDDLPANANLPAGGDQVFPDETGFSDKDPSTGLPPFSKTPLSSKDEPFFDDQDLLAEHDVPPESDELFENPPETGLEADAEVLNEDDLPANANLPAGEDKILLDEDFSEQDLSSRDEVLIAQVSDAIKEVLAPEAENFHLPENFKTTAEMFINVRQLCAHIPLSKQDEFLSHLRQARLDYAINRICGRPGLLTAANAMRELLKTNNA